MQLSADYYKAVTEDDRMAPVYWPAMIALQHNPRAMDLHAFLVYRMRSGLERPITLPMNVLHAMFGKDIKLQKHFITTLSITLSTALEIGDAALKPLPSCAFAWTPDHALPSERRLGLSMAR